MTYKFLDVIKDIADDLSYKANKAQEELQSINARQKELQADLAELEPRQLRAQSLKSRDDLICADCFIVHGTESPLSPIDGYSHVDRFRCQECKSEYELEI